MAAITGQAVTDAADRELAQEVIMALYLKRRTREPGERRGDLPLDKAYHLDRCNREASRMFRGVPTVKLGIEKRR